MSNFDGKHNQSHKKRQNHLVHFRYQLSKFNGLNQGQLQPGHITRYKIFKSPFFRDISKSFHLVTQMGLEPQKKFWKNVKK